MVTDQVLVMMNTYEGVSEQGKGPVRISSQKQEQSGMADYPHILMNLSKQ